MGIEGVTKGESRKGGSMIFKSILYPEMRVQINESLCVAFHEGVLKTEDKEVVTALTDMGFPSEPNRPAPKAK